ncbi:hypothetical protein GCM10008098_09990 [Rhodanobacter panaciterrae]|uniref:Uncharacterized protein n=1 Tax=Rhodanobacter panaciterrae TaxID=490572 RepID=A0ABQ2ZQA5_9GAMM|nr:hypothetical protein [Rhodanobacter panaciterrae]GGY19645.1 hypothetical protein GCM10008098_09990 [Rhodanobacter panaciterrae]
MGIEAVIAAERQRYVDFYAETKARLTASGSDVVGELLISINNDEIPYPYRYVRADIVSKGDDGAPQLSEVRIDTDPAFEATGYNFGAFQVEVYPFTWCSVQVVFDKPPKSESQIEDWITRRLDVDDRGGTGLDGLSGAVHSFSPVESNGEWWFLTADFGTAPADALIEFIELLASQGMSKIVLKAG